VKLQPGFIWLGEGTSDVFLWTWGSICGLYER